MVENNSHWSKKALRAAQEKKRKQNDFLSRREEQLRTEGKKRAPNSTPLNTIELTGKALEFCEANKWKTVGELCQKSKKELLDIAKKQNASRFVVRDIETALAEIGRTLKEEK